MIKKGTRLDDYTKMLHELATDVVDLYELASRHKMTRLDMAKWVARPRHSGMIDELERLAHRRASLLVAAGRADAALALGKIVCGDLTHTRDKEVARKACLDLLKLGPLQTTPTPEPPALSPAAACEANLRASLAALATESDLEELQEAPEDESDPAGSGAD